MGYTGGMLHLGASGFSHDDWPGNFCAISLPRPDWFACYTREFNGSEINSIHYTLPLFLPIITGAGN